MGPYEQPTDAHLPGQPPTGPLDKDVTGALWCGHTWSMWLPLAPEAIATMSSEDGLYRIHGREQTIVHVGEGMLREPGSPHTQRS